jgi:hypothetical protein
LDHGPESGLQFGSKENGQQGGLKMDGLANGLHGISLRLIEPTVCPRVVLDQGSRLEEVLNELPLSIIVFFNSQPSWLSLPLPRLFVASKSVILVDIRRQLFANKLGIPAQYGIGGIPQFPGNGGLPTLTFGSLSNLGQPGSAQQ